MDSPSHTATKAHLLTCELTCSLTPIAQLGGVSYGLIMLLVSIFGGGGMLVLEGLTFLRAQVLCPLHGFHLLSMSWLWYAPR